MTPEQILTLACVVLFYFLGLLFGWVTREEHAKGCPGTAGKARNVGREGR